MKHQIYQKACIKVYDLWQSFQLMCQWIVQKPQQQQGDAKEMLASLKQLCAVRISFGQAAPVPGQQLSGNEDLLETSPCALEIRIDR